ncbi:NUDIX hydrolase [Actinorugispora endophytica]|nr:NUDIX domain-containing protein [Actinorugispora endophytica]
MSLPPGPSGDEGALPGSAPSVAAGPAGPGVARHLGGEVPPRVRDVLSGRVAPAEPRDAATVMLVRGRGGGLEVYLLRRVPSMRFAPGVYVFPGGSVDPRDADHRVRWAGPPPAEWARRLGEDEPLARSLVCAAVRETFEESGVLLAGASEHEVVADTRGDDWEADRRSLVDHTLSFAEFLDRRGLVLRSDLLRPWSRWVTPTVEPRRFDTRFFAAVLPEGQQTRDVGGEADHVTWLRPAEAIRLRRAGELAMMAPTVANLKDLVGRAAPEDVLATEREVVPITPELREVAGELTLVLPDGVDYPL